MRLAHLMPRLQLRLKGWQWLLLVVAVLALLDWSIRRPDGRARAINAVLEKEGSARLLAYPYHFHVLRVEGQTAVLATPRNAEVPAFRMLGVLYPKVDVKNPNDPAFIALQEELGAVQAEARGIVARQPGITNVRWELDKDWLRAHYIELPQ